MKYSISFGVLPGFCVAFINLALYFGLFGIALTATRGVLISSALALFAAIYGGIGLIPDSTKGTGIAASIFSALSIFMGLLMTGAAVAEYLNGFVRFTTLFGAFALFPSTVIFVALMRVERSGEVEQSSSP